jgi:hypothetical protein
LRHHPRKRLRCRPFGGFLHAILPRPGHESSSPAKASIAQMFLLGTPLDDIRFDDSPVTEYRQCENRLAIRREFGSEVADLCAGGDVF